jgi:hypothetical protein
MLKKTASRRGVAWLVPRAHGTPTMKGMEADDLLCSRNARPQKALVGRAQWKINQPPSLKREQPSSDRSIRMEQDMPVSILSS